MKRSHHLFELIHSMTKNEKRYFKICASKHVIGGKNNYVLLFDFISKQKEYDEDLIRKKFSKENFIKRLSAAKYDLYRLILRSLNEYHITSTTKGQLRDYLQNAQILIDKALYQHADKILKTAKVLAYKFDEFRFILEIIDQELKVIKRMGTTVEMRPEIELLEEESQVIRKRMHNIGEYDRIGLETTKRMNSIGRPRNDQEKKDYNSIVNCPTWSIKEEDLTNMEKVHMYHAKALFFFAMNDIEACYEYTSKRVDLYEQFTEQITDHSTFLSALYNLEVTCNSLKKYKKGKEVREKIKNFESKYPHWKLTENNRVQIFKSLNNELIYLIDTAQYDEANDLVKKIEDQLDFYRDKLGRSDEVILFFNIVNLCIYSEKPKDALKWVSRLLYSDSVSYREDVHAFARILNLIIHFELGNYDVLPYYVRSTYRYLKKGERTFKVENLIVSFIRTKLPHIPVGDFQVMQSAFLELKAGILEIIKTDPYEKGCLDYFNLICWLDSKIDKTTFKEVYQKTYPERILKAV